MNSTKLLLSGIFISIIMVIETIAIYSGESLVIITVLSAIPIYFISRVDCIYGVISYFCVGILLFGINPHQMLFFMGTNGLVGLSLGVCKTKIKIEIIAIFLSSVFLFIGLSIVMYVIGILTTFYIKWYFIVAVVVFCFIYIIFCNWLFAKIYAYIKKITKLNLL